MKINNPNKFNILFKIIKPTISNSGVNRIKYTFIGYRKNNINTFIGINLLDKTDSVKTLKSIESEENFQEWITKIE